MFKTTSITTIIFPNGKTALEVHVIKQFFQTSCPTNLQISDAQMTSIFYMNFQNIWLHQQLMQTATYLMNLFGIIEMCLLVNMK
jgi:hypothetical protein